MDHKEFSSLYAIWLYARDHKTLPTEWELFIDFRAWAVENGYNARYGYEGKFTAGSLLLAIPGTHVGINLASGPDKAGGRLDPDDLIKRMNLEGLKKLAADMGVDIGDAKTKREIAQLLAAVDVAPGRKEE